LRDVPSGRLFYDLDLEAAVKMYDLTTDSKITPWLCDLKNQNQWWTSIMKV